MSTAFCLNRRPRSVNATRSQSYFDAIAGNARAKHRGEMFDGPLYSRILWFHKRRSSQGDIDNVAKKIHDALKNVVFDDDALITHSLAIRVDASVDVDLLGDEANPNAFAELAEMLADPDTQDILYVEVGLQPQRRIHLGPVIP